MNKHIVIPMTVLIGIGTAGPLAAACMDEIAKLEERLSSLPPDQQRDEQVSVKTQQGDVELKAEAGGEEPAESWFHEPQSPEGVADQLENARALARDGEEEGCMEQVQQAERVLSGLES